MTDDDTSTTEPPTLELAAGKPLLLKLISDSVVITYSFHLVDADGETIIKTWSGKTTDEDDDEEVIPANSLLTGRRIFWQLLLFGSVHGAISYSIAIDYSQDDKQIAEDPSKGTVETRKVTSLSGTRTLKVKP